MAALTHFPKIRLSELVGRFGGVTRSDAVANARKELESLRNQSDEVIENSIEALEKLVYRPDRADRHSAAQMQQILVLGDQIVTLAGTFGYAALDQTTRSLCDVADGLLRTGRADVASVNVHMRAMRMVSPKAPQISSEQLETMLAELRKILAHHGFDQLSSSADKVSFEDSTAPGQ
ncbi:MAG: hypothetical protein ACREFW_04985 [Rhizomicrobium sp.]